MRLLLSPFSCQLAVRPCMVRNRPVEWVPAVARSRSLHARRRLQERQGILGRDGIALAITALLLLAFAAALLIPQDQAEMLRTFTPEHIEMLGMFDSRGQQRAHRLLVVLLAILGVAALLTRRRSVKLAVPRAVLSCVHLVRDNAGIGVLAGVAVCFLLYRGTQPATSYAVVQGAYYPLALLPSALSQLSAMAGGTLAVLAYCWAMRQPAIGARAGALKLASMLALAVYAFILCVTTFAIPPDLREFTLRRLVGGGVALQRQPGRGRPVGDGHAARPRSPQRGSALRRAACERRAGHGTLQLRHPYQDRTGAAGAVSRSDRGCIVELVSAALAPRSPRLASYFPLGRALARGGPVPEPVRMAVSRACCGRPRPGRALRAPARALRGVSRLRRGHGARLEPGNRRLRDGGLRCVSCPANVRTIERSRSAPCGSAVRVRARGGVPAACDHCQDWPRLLAGPRGGARIRFRSLDNSRADTADSS